MTAPGGTESYYTDQKDFTRTFSTLGTWTIKQLVTDDKGKSAQVSQQLEVINRPPTAALTVPGGTDAAHPTVNTPPFTAAWAYDDPDGDLQTKFQLLLYDEGTKTTIVNSGIVNSSADTFNINANLLSGEVYAIQVRVFDGTDWSEWSEPKYFTTNRPPTGTLSIATPIFMHDTPVIAVSQTDPDGDAVDIVVAASFNGGPYAAVQCWAGVPPGETKSFAYGPLSGGSYVLRLTLDDGHGGIYNRTYTFSVGPLEIGQGSDSCCSRPVRTPQPIPVPHR